MCCRAERERRAQPPADVGPGAEIDRRPSRLPRKSTRAPPSRRLRNTCRRNGKIKMSGGNGQRIAFFEGIGDQKADMNSQRPVHRVERGRGKVRNAVARCRQWSPAHRSADHFHHMDSGRTMKPAAHSRRAYRLFRVLQHRICASGSRNVYYGITMTARPPSPNVEPAP